MIKKILFISLLVISIGVNVVLIRKMFVGNTVTLPDDTRVSIVVSQSNRGLCYARDAHLCRGTSAN